MVMAEDEGFPPTQAIERTLPIFHDQAGTPLEVFVDPGAVTNRPKLVRNLRKLGAQICVAVAEAQLILVDSSTKPGRQFIRDWGQDGNKLVLEYSWARKSVDAGRALLEADDWGGCKAIYDGSLSDNDDDDDDADQERSKKIPAKPHHLPTPRPTPTQRVSVQDRDRDSSGPSVSAVKQAEPVRETFQQQQPVQAVDSSQSYQVSNSNALVQRTSYPQSLSFQAHAAQPHPLSQPMHDNSGQQSTQSQFTYGNPAQSQPYTNVGSQSSPQYASTMMDVLRYNGLGPQELLNYIYMTQGYNMQQPFYLTQQPLNGTPPPSQQSVPGTFTMLDAPALDSLDSMALSDPPGNMSPPRDPIPKPRRKSSSSASRSKEKRKKADTSKAHARRRHSSSSPDDRETSFTPLLRSSPEDDVSRHLSPRPKKGSSRPPGMIFTTESGAQLSFFVQVDLTNRLSVVNKIKKNRGKIVSDNGMADYVILDSSREKDFESLLSSTLVAENIPLRASFVHDCVEEGALLGTTDYVFKQPVSQKRKRSWLSSGSPVTQRRKSELQKPRMDERKLNTKKADGTVETDSDVIRRSPTPPTQTSRTAHFSGRYPYTEDEHDYFLRYARLLLERDVNASYNSIAMKMHRKMPWHTFGSWRTFLSQHFTSHLEAIRNELDKKNAQPQVKFEVAEQQQDVNLETSPTKEARLDPTPDNNGTLVSQNSSTEFSGSELEQEDFRVICEFFAFGQQSSGDDNEVWASLTNHRSCRSQPSWQEFYVKHMEEINREIERLSQQHFATLTDMESISAGPSTDFLQPRIGSEPGEDPVITIQAIK